MATRIPLLRFAPASDRQAASEAAAYRQALMLPALLTVIMLVIGFSSARLAGLDASGPILPYLVGAGAFAILSAMVYVFAGFARLALRLADNPIDTVWQDVRTRAPMLLLPMLVFPLFLAGFTTAKSAIPFLVGYGWDAFWADADKIIFGDDAWRIAQRLLGTGSAGIWEMFYSTTWLAGLFLFKANVALYAAPRRVGLIFTAMMLTWIVAGWFLAYAMSAAGPVYAHLFDPVLTERFTPLRDSLGSMLSPDSTTRLTQAYLVEAMNRPVVVKGGGISAMPSMHLAVAAIYVLAARRTPWLLPAVVFWMIIFLGSAYFGWHYWVDGIVGAAVAWACWHLAEACFQERKTTASAYAASRS